MGVKDPQGIDLKERTAKNINIEIIMVAMVIVAFLAFYTLKVNGYYDFTHNYGIRDITATIDRENVMLLIDGDEKTTWNAATFLGETKAKSGDHITVYFDDVREISSIRMYGDVPDDMIIKTGVDEEAGGAFLKASNGEYIADTPVSTDTLVIEAGGETSETWNISELEVR